MTPLIPRDNSFFDMFSQMSENLITGARTMVELFTDYTDVAAKVAEIRRIERIGDEMTLVEAEGITNLMFERFLPRRIGTAPIS